MTKIQLKQLIRECIKEIKNESFGTYQGQTTPLRSLYNKIKSDPIIRKNKIDIDINDSANSEPMYHSIDLTHGVFGDFSIYIRYLGSKNKYEVDIPYFGQNQDDPTTGSSKQIVTDEKGVIRIIHDQIKKEIGSV